MLHETGAGWSNYQFAGLVRSSMAGNEETAGPPLSKTRLREMRKYYRQSQKALLPYAIIGVVVTAVGIGVHFWGPGGGCSWWAWVILLIIAWHGFLGDLLNILYLRPRIAAAESNQPDENGGEVAR